MAYRLLLNYDDTLFRLRMVFLKIELRLSPGIILIKIKIRITIGLFNYIEHVSRNKKVSGDLLLSFIIFEIKIPKD